MRSVRFLMVLVLMGGQGGAAAGGFCSGVGTTIASSTISYVSIAGTIGTVSASCTAVGMGGAGCRLGPTATAATMFYAVANPVIATSPTCTFNCSCGVTASFVIDGSDGLPVELLEFSIGAADDDGIDDHDDDGGEGTPNAEDG